MASVLHRAQLPIAPAVGVAAAAEFNAYLAVYQQIPNFDKILAGDGAGLAFPDEPSARYATTLGLTTRAADAQMGYHAFRWMVNAASVEWVQLCATDLFRVLRAKGQMRALTRLIGQDEALQKFLTEYQNLTDLQDL
jgi:hypothetical protein